MVLFEQPWVVAGRKVATPPATLDDGLRAAAGAAAAPHAAGRGRPLGRRPVGDPLRPTGLGAAGCLALAFPLHPPGRPEKRRLDELRGAGVPTLVVQGERDPFGRPEEFPGDLDHVDMRGRARRRPRLRGARSGGAISQDEAEGIVVESTLEWLVREVAGPDIERAGVSAVMCARVLAVLDRPARRRRLGDDDRRLRRPPSTRPTPDAAAEVDVATETAERARRALRA